MSLESAGFIKDLVPTNPEGTDPKSQGDDHLRMIKAVLKAQFSGFTQGVGITLTEGNLNALGGIAADDQPVNIDTVLAETRVIGVVTGSTGTLPPSAVAGSGELIYNLAWSTARIYQLYFRANNMVWQRVYQSGAWTGWVSLTPLGVTQTWQTDGTKALNTNYTNTNGRPIEVGVIVTGASTASIQSLQLQINGTTCALADISPFYNGSTLVAKQGAVNCIVPDGVTYRATTSAGAVLNIWRELR